MNDFANVFKKYYLSNENCWAYHCNNSSNLNDCVLYPSSQMNSEVRQHFNIDDDEKILFIRDTSFWNNRDQGTVITDKYFYLIPDNEKPTENIVFPWTDIEKVTYNDATIYFWQNNNINESYSIHVSWFLKNVSESSYDSYGRCIAEIFNECVQSAVDPEETIWNELVEELNKEQDPHEAISLVKKIQSQVPSDSWVTASSYVLIGGAYQELGDLKNARYYYELAIEHVSCDYGSVMFGEVCYRMESALDLLGDKQNIINIAEKRAYALMAARFADNEEKHETTNGAKATSREDADIDFDRFDDEYTNHFLELPYKDRKTLLIVDTFNNLFQDHFVTLYIDSDLSALAFPTGHPKVNELYVAHPLVKNRYMPFESYQLELIEDKVREFCELAQSLGATEIDIECINSNSSDTYNSGNTNISGGVSKGKIGVSGSNGNEYSRNLIEQLSHSISLHQEFQPHKAPVVPDNMVWYDSEPSWQRLSRQRIEGGLVAHEERIETKKSKIVNNREMNEIKGELQVLFTNMNLAFDKSEESKFEEQEDAVLAIKVKFAPISSLGNDTKSVDSQQTLNNDELAYLDEVKACLQNGEISPSERRLLSRLRDKLDISEARAAELEATVTAIHLTDDEKEYLEAYREAAVDGNVSDRERRILDRLRMSFEISEERAKELEQM